MSVAGVVAAYHTAMLHRSADELADLYAEDGLHEFPFGGLPPFKGREEVRAGYTMMWGAMEALVKEIRDVVIRQTTDPEVVVAEHETVVAVADQELTVPGLLILRVRDGLIVHTRDYMDTSAIARVRAA
ncbi:nuclear transport factor 2 family protein [Nonomuraea sp. NEAU-A123]|uniref:nuclear transport factor 2 family protein n=1 Tax=Nonomuraea sp. NEAU-A123 TaxID=2839649 RepID=UPI001BE404D7|nr:nuclear transport factor 2 family protein [Nonomuraea sp. NEAU-A123]MBT2234397.1 nuclear transport factor 2 family protein [Nonomuraea sp. NEAU-A123]